MFLPPLSKDVLIFQKNRHFPRQIPDDLLRDFATRLRDTRGVLDDTYMRTVNWRWRGITLADDLGNRLTKPEVFDIELYVEALIESVAPDDPSRLPEIRDFTEAHVPWVHSMVARFVDAPNKVTQGFCFYLQNVISYVHPRGLARVSLFMIVAYLSRSFEVVRRETLWWDLRLCISQGRYGGMYHDWDLLDRITFGWYLSAGIETGLSDF